MLVLSFHYPMAQHNELGKKGEYIAKQFLQKAGYEIVVTNWRWRKAEVDLIIQEETLLILVEVKTRSSAKYGQPYEAITPKKQNLLQDAAESYLAIHCLELEVRLDIISIIVQKNGHTIEHIKNAF